MLNCANDHHVGQAINPQGIEGQVEGAVVQGIWCWLVEESIVEICENKNPPFH